VRELISELGAKLRREASESAAAELRDERKALIAKLCPGSNRRQIAVVRSAEVKRGRKNVLRAANAPREIQLRHPLGDPRLGEHGPVGLIALNSAPPASVTPPEWIEASS
jgi:hypothetical protein